MPSWGECLIVEKTPGSDGDPEAPLQALIFDSVFNSFRGISYYRILNGAIRKGESKFVSTGQNIRPMKWEFLKLKMTEKTEGVKCGDVRYINHGNQECQR